MTKLYHTEIGLPENLLQQVLGDFRRLQYSRHAVNEALSDRYGAPKRLPTGYAPARSEIFEVEITDGWVTKFCVRVTPESQFSLLNRLGGFIPSRPGLDLILVLIPKDGEFFVKTLWFNDSNDKHATLDKNKYTKI